MDDRGPIDQASLAALDEEGEQLDHALLALFEKRLVFAERVGQTKDACGGGKLHPDRERAVLDRILSRASPDHHEAVAGLWREIVGWSLARQGPVQVFVWVPAEPVAAFDAARRRFGAAARIRSVPDAETALRRAAETGGIAVLAICPGEPWWIGLRREWSAFKVFDGLGGDRPTALAVAQVEISSRTTGRRIIVEEDDGLGRSADPFCLAAVPGWSLSLADARVQPRHPTAVVGSITSA